MKLEDMLAESLKDEGFRKEYEALEPEYMIKRTLIQARKEKNLTDQQLSQLVGLEVEELIELESGESNPSLSSLRTMAEGLGMTLKLEFVPQ